MADQSTMDNTEYLEECGLKAEASNKKVGKWLYHDNNKYTGKLIYR